MAVVAILEAVDQALRIGRRVDVVERFEAEWARFRPRIFVATAEAVVAVSATVVFVESTAQLF